MPREVDEEDKVAVESEFVTEGTNADVSVATKASPT